MKRWVVIGWVFMLLLLSGCGTGKEQSAKPEAGGAVKPENALAETLYQKNCLSCHGGNLQGGMGPDLRTIGASLGSEDIQAIIENGKGKMPQFKSRLDEKEIAELANWLHDMK